MLDLDDLLGVHVPEAAAAAGGVTLRRLLSHTAGLPYAIPEQSLPWTADLDWPAIARATVETPLSHEPGTRIQYGEVAYNLLAIVVERATGDPFGEAMRSLVLEPLAIEGHFGVEPPRLPAVIADIRGPHVGTPLEPLNSPFFRAIGFPAGGMVTTAGGALALVRAFQGRPSGFLKPETVAEATRNQAGDLAGGLFGPLHWTPCPWGLGPELHGEKAPHWAPRAASPGIIRAHRRVRQPRVGRPGGRRGLVDPRRAHVLERLAPAPGRSDRRRDPRGTRSLTWGLVRQAVRRRIG